MRSLSVPWTWFWECLGWPRWVRLRQDKWNLVLNSVTTTEYSVFVVIPHWFARLLIIVSYTPSEMTINVGSYGRWLESRSGISLESPKDLLEVAKCDLSTILASFLWDSISLGKTIITLCRNPICSHYHYGTTITTTFIKMRWGA